LRALIDSLKMKSFLANVRYTAVPVFSNMIQSIPNREEQILWVGCSDSHIDETDVLNVPRQELFVHRNLGNKLSNGDTSSLGAIEFCIQDIEVCFQVALSMDIIRLTISEG
jgi:carbonic anhydrase